MIAWEREYFYQIDLSGRLIHDGTILTDDKFLRFFFGRLKENDTGLHPEYPFVSPCGREMNFVRAEDTPVVYTRLENDVITGPGGVKSSFDPGALKFGPNNILYYPSPVGGYARVRSDLMLELARYIEPWGPWFAWKKDDGPASDVLGRGRVTVIEPVQMPEGVRLLRPRSDHLCFGCSSENPSGFGLSFLAFEADARVESWWSAPRFLQGPPGVLHGGFSSLLLDEIMAKTLTMQDLKVYTAHLEVDFKKPCPVDHPLALSARFEGRSGRRLHVTAEIKSASDGILFSRGSAIFVER